jgi:hypothetical protein
MTSTLTQPADQITVTPRFSGMKVTQARVIRSEWT